MRPTSLALALLTLACAPPPAADAGLAPSSDEGVGAAAPGADPAPQGAGTAAIAIERLDPGADCDGLVPDAAPEPVTVRLELPAGATCTGAVSDGTGAVAIGVRDAAGETTWRVHRADGAPAGAFAADAPLLPQPDGWHAVQVSPAAPGAEPEVDHVAISASGDVARRARVSPDPAVRTGARWHLSPDPAGGSAVAVRATHLGGNHWSDVTVHRFDAGGAPRWPGGAPALSADSAREPMFLAAGVPATGELLLLTQHSAFLDVTWLDPEARPAGGSVLHEPSADVVGEGLAHTLETAPLLDGSVALRSDGAWRRLYAPRSPTSGPLPAWLAARAEHGVRVAGGGLGYALLPPAGRPAPGCATQVDLVSRGGRTCGRIVLRESGACATGGVDQGWDGTLVHLPAGEACTVRWWPRLLGP